MFHPLQTLLLRSRRPLVVATVGMVTAAGAVVGVATSAPAAPAPPRVGHFVCYTASATGFTPPPTVLLQNQFSTAGFATQVGPTQLHCNPVQKTLPSGQIFRMVNPKAHLPRPNLRASATSPATRCSTSRVRRPSPYPRS
jgi:hypothetical protein